tara:strand:+ start:140 stop:433 length:294 start_codon:yes stop_codon:yes gene_type:complete
MCSLWEYSTTLVWIFLAGTAAMAIISRMLNDHLLVPPDPPKNLWFRKRNFIKPSYLMKPDLYFDEMGCRLAWRFTIVSAVSGFAFLLIIYLLLSCEK